MPDTLRNLKLRDFRCFESAALEFHPGFTFLTGPNAQGKTSLLEAACVLLRLQSPRTATLAHAVKSGRKGFVLDGHWGPRHLQVYFSATRRKLALDSVAQSRAGEFLTVGHVVYFGNDDIQIIRGPADLRRRFLDFVGAQVEPRYRACLRDYEKALRSRNRLLKAPCPNWRQIAAYDRPLVQNGDDLTRLRAALVAALDPTIAAAHHAISGGAAGDLRVRYLPGAGDDFAAALAASRDEDARLRQTIAGPHRDEMEILLNAMAAGDFASEGQQRTLALALRLAQAGVIQHATAQPPLLLLDDIFGELDKARRNALLDHLPDHSQKIVTSTHLDWLDQAVEGSSYHVGPDGVHPETS